MLTFKSCYIRLTGGGREEKDVPLVPPISILHSRLQNYVNTFTASVVRVNFKVSVGRGVLAAVPEL